MIFSCKWMFLIVLSICLVGCWEKDSIHRFRKGRLSQKQLEAIRGVAQNVQQTPTDQEVHQYPNNESFQINNAGQVTYSYRNPTTEEESLQYWLNRWQNDEYHPTPVGGSDHIDTPRSFYYINYDNNERFVYDKGVKKVIRVIYEMDIDDE